MRPPRIRTFDVARCQECDSCALVVTRPGRFASILVVWCHLCGRETQGYEPTP